MQWAILHINAYKYVRESSHGLFLLLNQTQSLVVKTNYRNDDLNKDASIPATLVGKQTDRQARKEEKTCK